MEHEPQVQTRKEQIAAIPRGILTYEEPSKDQSKLAKQAKRVLGYDGLLTFSAGGRLQAALEMLGIEVLDPKAVFEYQQEYGRAVLSKSIQFLTGDRDDSESDSASDELDDEGGRIRARRSQHMKTKSTSIHTHTWGRVEISRYQKAVPEFVVRKAIQVKEALPQVEIFVEELHRDPDPFLVVTFQGENYAEEYYIEVWEEPKFEGRFSKSS